MSRQLETGEFRLTLKAVTPDLDNHSPFSNETEEGSSTMRIRGIASGTGTDLHNDIVTEATIHTFKDAIEKGIEAEDGTWSLLPLRSGHGNNWDDILGWVTKADVDENNNLWIEAELDEDSSRARDLFTKLTKPSQLGRYVQLGFSIGGKITKFRNLWDAELKKNLRILEGILLREISVVGAPAYPPSYVEAITKSLDKIDDDNYLLEESMAEEKNEVQETPQYHEDSVAIEIPEEQNAEGTSPETTAVVDPSVNSPSAEPRIIVTSEQSTQESTNVEESTSESDNASEAPNADPIADIRTQIAQLTEVVSALNASLNTAQTSNEVTEEVVSKSAEVETDETDVHKAADATNLDALKSLIAEALTEAMADFKEELSVVKSAVDIIANEPMDKSLSVRKAKEDLEHDPMTIFKSKASELKAIGNKQPNVIGLAVREAMHS